MQQFELKITFEDWLYIVLIGSFFGFFISLVLFFLIPPFGNLSTIFFGTSTAVIITFFSSFFITFSNNTLLPYVNKKFWYVISFGFSFLSGALGFLSSYWLFVWFDATIIELIAPYSFYLSISLGGLTFLIGLILHQFITIKYNNEFIRNEILESKIKALENELNPHFLFNALNSMSELVYVNQKLAERSIVNLAKFLRNAIKQESLISIHDELSMVQTYVEIENIRFDEKILLKIEKDGSRADLLVPKFSVQLLVENAIKHGFLSKDLNIHININKNAILVSNDGKSAKNIKFGTGLNNLSKRLELLEVGSLEYLSEPQVTFVIRLKGKK